MTNDKIVAYLDAMWLEHQAQEGLLDVLESEIAPEPHAHLLLTNGRHEDAIALEYVLAHPKQLTRLDLPKRVRQQAERMWRRFGRDIDISIDVQPDNFIHVYGDLRHASAFIEEVIP